MKANELNCKDLMVGDWVIFHDSGYASDGTTWKEDRVCQIDVIDGDVRVKWYDEDGYKEDCPHVSTFCLSPIPLTPEILEKNGFVKELDKDNTHYRFGLTEGCTFFSVKYARSVFQWLGPLDFKYVHELQHALRLCGIEKEIEL